MRVTNDEISGNFLAITRLNVSLSVLLGCT